MQVEITWIDVLIVTLVLIIGAGVGIGVYSLSQPSDADCNVGMDTPTYGDRTAIETPTDASQTKLEVNDTHVVAGEYVFDRVEDNVVEYNGDKWIPNETVERVNDDGWYIEW